ncbi:MAG: nitric-oxide reductase large subunit [Deltaproteobacteria bacterium]|nr:nitric-oxide reductase large subunit [Deltaproteobacteria bacterium]
MGNVKARAVLLFLLVMAFGVLLFGGYLINRDKPPIPKEVVSQTGQSVYAGKDVIDGQNYFYSRGGQHIGTIWGHGAYLAPDWSADYLHRMGLFVAARHLGKSPEEAAAFTQADLDRLDAVTRARLTVLATKEQKTNRYEAATGKLIFTPYQTEAHASLVRYYTDLFRQGNSRMGLQAKIVRSDEEGRLVASFFSWLAWAAGTQRPDKPYTYTSNWPYDPLIGNGPLPSALIWSILSVILLILGISGAIFLYQRYIREEDYQAQPITTLDEPSPTPSQRATLAYFLIAIVLFVIQVGMGSVTGHYTVEGTSFYGIPIGDLLPYAAVRTWHLQLAVFFIATCFLAAGLFIGPYVGHEPRYQGVLVWALLVAVVVVVLGALGGTYASIQGLFGGDGFLFGHQGYEYIELGRVWQLLLILGMIVWLILVVRAIRPALSREKDAGGITHLLLYSAIAIPAFYMVGLLYGKGSHLSNAEYWRWWVVHLWVEGFFEVFATVFMAFLLARIGVVGARFALRAVYFSIFLYLGSGVIGTFHHLYWSGSPMPIVALGAVFSALEVVPLTLVGFEAVHNLRVAGGSGQNPYRWPIYFFVSVAFWNMLGAGVFGFLINPPIVLYYIQGLNTTPIHAHTALFGVYGLLAISLMLFSMRHTVRKAAWSDRLLKWSFWGLNGGLALMTLISLAPAGFYQFYFAVRDGMWYARSPEIASGEVIRALMNARIVPDIVFAAGQLLLLVFVGRAIWLSRSPAAAKERSKK